MRIWLKMQGTEEPLFSCKEEGRHGYKEIDSITAESRCSSDGIPRLHTENNIHISVKCSMSSNSDTDLVEGLSTYVNPSLHRYTHINVTYIHTTYASRHTHRHPCPKTHSQTLIHRKDRAVRPSLSLFGCGAGLAQDTSTLISDTVESRQD